MTQNSIRSLSLFGLFAFSFYFTSAQSWHVLNPLMRTNKILVHSSGIYVTGSNDSAYYEIATVTKYDFNGNKLFETPLPAILSPAHSDQEISIDTIPHTNDLVVLVSNRLSTDNNFKLIRLDSTGKIKWTSTFSYSQWYYNQTLVDATSKPGKIITLTADSSNKLQYRVWDTTGIEILVKPLNILVKKSSFFLDQVITKAPNGYLIFNDDPNGITKIDFEGNHLWKQYPDWFFNNGATMTTLSNGNTMMLWADAGVINTYTNPYIGYHFLNSTGTIIKSNQISVPFTEIKNIYPTENNGFLICGGLDSGIIMGSWGYGSFANVVQVDSNFSNPQYMEYHPFFHSIHQIHKHNDYFIGLGLFENNGQFNYYLFSDTFSFKKIDWRVGIEEASSSRSQNIHFYPNPASDMLYVNNPYSSSISVSLYTLTGERIYESTLKQQSFSINTSEFNSGIYVIAIKKEDGNILYEKLSIE
ncbi:MAG: T9SS type A sorting domain-containing protein [Bacteroidota bacterium]